MENRGTICDFVYQVTEGGMSEVMIDLDGHVCALFRRLDSVVGMFDELDLTFVQATFSMDGCGKPCFGHTCDLDEARVLIEGGVTVDLVYQDSFETPFYFKVMRREIW
jgi:hypothetical protein